MNGAFWMLEERLRDSLELLACLNLQGSSTRKHVIAAPPKILKVYIERP